MSVARLNYVKHARQPYAKVTKTDDEGNAVRVPVTSKRTGEQKVGRGGRAMTKRVSVRDTSRPLPLLKCGKCGDEIAVGSPYRWFTVGFRSHYKQIRCTKSACTPRESERESSGIRAEILGAIEDFNDTMAGFDSSGITVSDVEAAVQSVGEAFRSAADQWREADEQFGGGGNTESGERADTAESGADELESWGSSLNDEPDYDECEDEIHLPLDEREDKDDDREPVDKGDMECDSCSQIREDWFDELVEEANNAVEGAEVP